MIKLIRRVFNLLTKQQRKESVGIIASMLLRSILDFAGIAALVPVVFVIADKLGNTRRLVLLLCCGVVIFVILKNSLIYLLTKFQSKYQLDIYRDFSRRLFINYYNRGLMFLKKHSSVQLAYEVNGYSLIFSQSVLGSLLRIAGEVFLILLLVTALIAWKPIMGLLTAALFLPLAATYAATIKKRIKTIGAENLKAQRAQARTVAEAYRGYAELEIADAFEYSLNSFDHNQQTIIFNRGRMELYQLFPFFLSEMAVVAGLIILALFGGDDLMVTGAVFAIAAFRVIPAVRGVMNNYAVLQNNIHSIDIIEKGLSRENISFVPKGEIVEQTDNDIQFETKIEVRDLSFAFPDGKILFSNLNFEILKGERIGIRGRSGTGKSTLFNILLGFLNPSEGQIIIDNNLLVKNNRHSWHKIVGYVPQEIFIIQGTLAENIALGCETIDRNKINEVLEQVSLSEWAIELKEGLDTDLGEFGSRLSGGQKQRIGIARALYKGATVLFFDEATSSLDSETEKEITSALEDLSRKHEELTMVIIAHRESSLKICHRIIDL